MSGGFAPCGNGSAGADGRTQSCRCGGAIGPLGVGVATDYTDNATSPRHGTSIQPYSHAGIGLHERSSVAHGRAHSAPPAEPRPRPSHAKAPWLMAMAVDHRAPPPDRSSHASAAAADDHREPPETTWVSQGWCDYMGIRPIALRASPLTAREAAVLGALAASARQRQGRRGQCWTITRDHEELWALPKSWTGLVRVGFDNGIHCTLDCNRSWFQLHVLTTLRQYVAERKYAMIHECLDAHRLPSRVADRIAFMVMGPRQFGRLRRGTSWGTSAIGQLTA